VPPAAKVKSGLLEVATVVPNCSTPPVAVMVIAPQETGVPGFVCGQVKLVVGESVAVPMLPTGPLMFIV
jgi:hypothetical protein